MDKQNQNIRFEINVAKKPISFREIRILHIDMTSDFEIKVDYLTTKGEFKSGYIGKALLDKIIIE